MFCRGFRPHGKRGCAKAVGHVHVDSPQPDNKVGTCSQQVIAESSSRLTTAGAATRSGAGVASVTPVRPRVWRSTWCLRCNASLCSCQTSCSVVIPNFLFSCTGNSCAIYFAQASVLDSRERPKEASQHCTKTHPSLKMLNSPLRPFPSRRHNAMQECERRAGPIPPPPKKKNPQHAPSCPGM